MIGIKLLYNLCGLNLSANMRFFGKTAPEIGKNIGKSGFFKDDFAKFSPKPMFLGFQSDNPTFSIFTNNGKSFAKIFGFFKLGLNNPVTFFINITIFFVDLCC
jgi:hypothetical protein